MGLLVEGTRNDEVAQWGARPRAAFVAKALAVLTPVIASVMATIAVAGMFDYQLMVTAPTWPWVTFWLPFGLAIGAEMAVRRLGTGAAAGGRAHETAAQADAPGGTDTETRT